MWVGDMPTRPAEVSMHGLRRGGEMPARTGEVLLQGVWRGGDMCMHTDGRSTHARIAAGRGYARTDRRGDVAKSADSSSSLVLWPLPMTRRNPGQTFMLSAWIKAPFAGCLYVRWWALFKFSPPPPSSPNHEHAPSRPPLAGNAHVRRS